MKLIHKRPVLMNLALVAYVVGMAGGLALDDPRLRFPTYLVCQAFAWLGMLVILAQHPRTNLVYRLIIVGLLFRMWAVWSPPAFSEDVFRYVYEGKVALWGGIFFPFEHPPADGPQMGVPYELRDEAWLRINHPELASIYPPLAQLVFICGAFFGSILGGNALLCLKAILLGADLSTWYLLHRFNSLAGLTWGLAPLVILEVSREGHADVLSALGLTAGALGFAYARPLYGYAGWLCAALAKLNGLILIPLALRTTRKGAWIIVPGLVVLLVPYIMTTGQDTSGIAAYATRWRSGDGAYSLLLLTSEYLLGGDWISLQFGTQWVTITKHQCARGLVVALFGLIYSLVLLGPQPLRSETVSVPQKHLPALSGFILLCLLLLSPTLHPWYLLWLLPFATLTPFPGRMAAFWLVASAAILHHPGWIELTEGSWRELAVLRAFIHIPAWGLLIWDLLYGAKRESTVGYIHRGPG